MSTFPNTRICCTRWRIKIFMDLKWKACDDISSGESRSQRKYTQRRHTTRPTKSVAFLLVAFCFHYFSIYKHIE